MFKDPGLTKKKHIEKVLNGVVIKPEDKRILRNALLEYGIIYDLNNETNNQIEINKQKKREMTVENVVNKFKKAPNGAN